MTLRTWPRVERLASLTGRASLRRGEPGSPNYRRYERLRDALGAAMEARDQEEYDARQEADAVEAQDEDGWRNR